MGLFELKDFFGDATKPGFPRGLQDPFRSPMSTTRGPPMFNEPSNVSRSSFFFRSQPIDYRELFRWIKRTPEAIGILNAIVTDILSDKFYFQNANPKNKGKSNIKRAKEFCEENFFKQVLWAGLFDWLGTGDCYLWLGTLTDVQIKEFITKRLKSLRRRLEFKDVGVKDFSVVELKQHLINEDSLLEKVEHVATSTMNILFEESSVTGYVQNVGTFTRGWKPDQIIHAKLMLIDGKVHGFSPLVASMSSMTTLGLMKDYNGNFFNNGGVPDFMFILAKEMAGSPNVRKLEQVLQEFKPSTQSRSNMVFTGEIEAVPLTNFDKDMEFQKLAIYHTGVLALAFNMPLDRVLTIVGAGVKGKSSDMTESGYWNQISGYQDYWEQLLNNHLFVPFFGVKIRFRRQYLQNQVREAQTMTMKLDGVQKMFSLGIPVNDQYVFNFLGMTDDDLESDATIDKDKALDSGLSGQNQLNNMQALSEPNKIAESNRKKNEESVQDKSLVVQRKDVFFESKDVVHEVKFDVFKMIVEDFMKKTKSLFTRVHYYEDGDSFVCYFSTPDWKYLSKPEKSSLSPTDVAFIIKSGVRIERSVKDASQLAADVSKEDLAQLELRLIEQFEGLKDGKS